METLKNDYYDTEQITVQINKREDLLGMERTIFTALKIVQDELRPLHDLWTLANQFNETFGVWMEEKFERLESDQIERTVNEWTRALSKLSKTVLNQYTKPKELIIFLQRVLEKFRVRRFRIAKLVVLHANDQSSSVAWCDVAPLETHCA